MDVHHLDPHSGQPPAEVGLHFQGHARLQTLSSPFPGGPAVFAVHFDPGGRTMPHTHTQGQVLVVTDGQGIVGGPDGIRRHVAAGDVVVVEPGEWHWHGGTPTAAMTHVTVQMTGPDSIDWAVPERDWAEGYDA